MLRPKNKIGGWEGCGGMEFVQAPTMKWSFNPQYEGFQLPTPLVLGNPWEYKTTYDP
jgi:hypothetical protein